MRAWTLRPVVDEALRPRNVEAMKPVAQRLAIHAANLRRRSVHSIADRRQRQKPAALADVLRSASEPAKLFRRIVFSHLTADGMARISRAQKSQKFRPVGIPSMSQSEGPLVHSGLSEATLKARRPAYSQEQFGVRVL
jgi:hypothetical protein